MLTDTREIHTERLVLRAPTHADRTAAVAIQTDPDTHRHSPVVPTQDRATEEFNLWLEHWEEHSFGYWLINEADSNELIGLGGVQHRELDGENVLNLYYRFLPKWWGKGFASEMATTVVRWAQEALPQNPVVIITNVGNEAACRVAEKLGFHEYMERTYRGELVKFFRMR